MSSKARNSEQNARKSFFQRFRKSRAQLPPKVSDISVTLSESDRCRKTSKDDQLLLSFRNGNLSSVKQSILEYIKEDVPCDDVAILNITSSAKFTVFAFNENVEKMTYSTKIPGILDTLSSKFPVIVERNLELWKPVFLFVPNFLILIPVILAAPVDKPEVTRVETITALAFKGSLPETLTLESSWHVLIASCRLMAPLLVNVHRHEESARKLHKLQFAMDGIRTVEKEIQTLSNCIATIGLELQTIFSATNSVIFVMEDDPYEPVLVKYGTFGGGKIDAQCPDKQCHTLDQLPQSTQFPAGWVALNKTCLRINDASQLEKKCSIKGPLHSVGGCIVKNLMCFIIYDHSADMPLVVELTDKIGGFTDEDEIEALRFAKLASHILSSSVMLDYRKKAIRRCDITNELLNNIKTVQFTKVKHLLDMKFQYSTSFQKKFYTTKFIFKPVSDDQYSGVILHMFTELGLISRWKIRRATLIRFILSVHQGYRDNPYHNWKHACSVTHFAFILLNKMDLSKKGFLTELEALALMVACLTHDINHMGVNSHFSLCVDADPFHIYKQEDGLHERHHVAVTLQILASDDCNIVENLSDTEYAEFIELVQWNILATDIGKYLNERNDLFKAMKKFDKKKKQNRLILSSLVMTMCDLCETVKPWNDYIITVKNIFSEFFTQGDEERKLGYEPTPIMDARIAYIPYIEMKFINEIVRPVYEAIAKILPKTEECLFTIDYFKELWLVATQVFDDNLHLENPLDIIQLPEMREENLKSEKNHELEKHVGQIRRSIRVIDIPINNRTGSLIALSTRSNEDIRSELQPEKERRKTCSECLVYVLCCYRCRRKALYDASYVRRTHNETLFMEQRSEEYERRRSLELEHNVNTAFVRERIHSLINPNLLHSHVHS